MALALQIGYRKSINLDFFGHMEITPIELRQTLRAYGEISLRNANGHLVIKYHKGFDELIFDVYGLVCSINGPQWRCDCINKKLEGS